MVIEIKETPDDDWHCHGDDPNTDHSAGRPDDLRLNGGRDDVTVSHRRHGNQGVPHGVWDGLHSGAVVGVVEQRGEGHHQEKNEAQQQQQLLAAGPEREVQDTEPNHLGHGPQEAKDAQQLQHVDGVQQRGVKTVLGVDAVDDALDDRRQKGDGVRDVDEVGAEVARPGAEEEAKEKVQAQHGQRSVAKVHQPGHDRSRPPVKPRQHNGLVIGSIRYFAGLDNVLVVCKKKKNRAVASVF